VDGVCRYCILATADADGNCEASFAQAGPAGPTGARSGRTKGSRLANALAKSAPTGTQTSWPPARGIILGDPGRTRRCGINGRAGWAGRAFVRRAGGPRAGGDPGPCSRCRAVDIPTCPSVPCGSHLWDPPRGRDALPVPWPLDQAGMYWKSRETLEELEKHYAVANYSRCCTDCCLYALMLNALSWRRP